jgi:hypothetical protein
LVLAVSNRNTPPSLDGRVRPSCTKLFNHNPIS